MDHRVSKDMISSGMTPSGEKTQADLGKTQYGSAPSPNRLMDAYHSMYQNQKEETLKEGDGLYANIHKKRKSGRKMRNKGDKGAPSSQDFANAAKTAREDTDLLAAYQSIYADTFEEGKIPAGLQAYLDKKKGKKKDDDNGDDEKEGKKKDKKDVKEAIKPRLLGVDPKPGTKAASTYNKQQQIKKDRKSGVKQLELDNVKPFSNVTPPSSKQLNLTYDKPTTNKDIKRDKLLGIMNKNEDVDLFDLVSTKLIEEGYDEKDVYKVMSNLTEEQLNEFFVSGTIAALAAKGAAVAGAAKAGGAALAAKGAAAAGKVGAVAAKSAAAAGKIGATAGKGIVAAGKGVGKGVASAAKSAKGAASGFKKGLMTKPTQMTKVTGDVAGASNKVTPLSQKVGQGTRKGLAMMKNNPMNTYLGYSAVSSTMQPSASSKPQQASVVKNNADLFDIVKGQLLDEGCTEEEVNEIMTTLTPEEILNEISGKLAMKASKAADLKRAELAKAGDRAGAADKAAQASRLYKKGAERNLAKQDLSKPLNPQRTDYPMGKGASYQQKPNM